MYIIIDIMIQYLYLIHMCVDIHVYVENVVRDLKILIVVTFIRWDWEKPMFFMFAFFKFIYCFHGKRLFKLIKYTKES